MSKVSTRILAALVVLGGLAVGLVCNVTTALGCRAEKVPSISKGNCHDHDGEGGGSR